MRTDPSETGGLFLGRRPDSARLPPSKKDKKPQRLQSTLLVIAMVLIGISFWGPVPIAWLWIGAQIQYFTEHTLLALLLTFFGIFTTLIGGLIILRWLDRLWLSQQAYGDTQPAANGIAIKIFAASALIGGTLFTVWFIFFGGLGPMLAPH